MKNIVKKSSLVLAMVAMLSSCDNFDEINVNPTAANADQVQVEYFINNSIIGAQMNPDVAERSFVLYWKTAGHQMLSTGISGGSYDDGWSSAYYNSSANWLNAVNTAIQIADEQQAKGIVKRIYSEATDVKEQMEKNKKEKGSEFIPLEDREIVAMIAYLQRLGTDIKTTQVKTASIK